MIGTRATVVCITAEALRFLLALDIKVKETGKFEVGSDFYRDFRYGEITLRVQLTAPCWSEDELTQVLREEDRRREQNNRSIGSLV